jgi:hypothetical protein
MERFPVGTRVIRTYDGLKGEVTGTGVRPLVVFSADHMARCDPADLIEIRPKPLDK